VVQVTTEANPKVELSAPNEQKMLGS